MFDKKFLRQVLDSIVEDRPTKNSRILIIDSMNTFIRNFSSINSLNPAGHHIGGLVGYLRSIGYVIKSGSQLVSTIEITGIFNFFASATAMASFFESII